MLWGGCARVRDPEVLQGGSQGLPDVLTPGTLSKRPVLLGANAPSSARRLPAPSSWIRNMVPEAHPSYCAVQEDFGLWTLRGVHLEAACRATTRVESCTTSWTHGCQTVSRGAPTTIQARADSDSATAKHLPHTLANGVSCAGPAAGTKSRRGSSVQAAGRRSVSRDDCRCLRRS